MAWSRASQKMYNFSVFGQFFLQTFLQICKFFADSKSRAQELSNDGFNFHSSRIDELLKIAKPRIHVQTVEIYANETICTLSLMVTSW